MKKLISIITAIILTVSLVSCSGGISGDEAKNYINDFFDAVEVGAEDKDYVIAESFLHPDCPTKAEDLIESVAEAEDVDFSSIEIERYTNFRSAYYDSKVDGSVYSLTMNISVSGESAKAEIELVNNDKGYGIHNIDIKFE